MGSRKAFSHYADLSSNHYDFRRHVVVNTLLFGFSAFSVLLTSGSILRVSFLANLLLVFFSLLAVAIITANQMDKKALRQKHFWLLIALSFSLLVSQLEPQTKPIVAQAYVLTLLTLILAIPRTTPKDRSARIAVMWTLLSCFVLSLAIEMSSTAWFFMEGYARNASYFLGRVFGLSLKLGPTAMGLSGLAFCIIYTWVRISPWLGQLWKRGVTVTIILLCTNHFGAIFLAWLANAVTEQKTALMAWDQVAKQGFTALDFIPILFLAQCVVLCIFLEGSIKAEENQTAESVAGSRRIIVGSATGWFLLVSIAYVTSQWPAGGYDGRVVLYQGGITSWSKPNFEQLGSSNRPGLFCVLPDYLHAFGFHVELTKKISPSLLANTDVFVVMNFNEEWEREDYALLNDYIKNGGTLMVFADHTDMSGLMKGSNDLLRDVPIRVNFDSAHFLNNYWNHALVTHLHPINRKSWDKDGIGVSVGASLDLLNHRASPFLFARYGFSDRGDRMNDSFRNYLGDRIYNADEPIGDIVLAAESKLEKGKVIVFGDTALLQMGSLVHCQRYVADLFRWAVHGKSSRLPWSLLLVVVLVSTFWLAHLQRQHFVIVAAVIVSISLAIMIGESVLQLSYEDHEYNGPIAYLDHSHVSLCDHEGYSKDDGDTYLVDNAVRNGFVPMAWKEFNKKALEKSALMISMAATKPFSEKQAFLIDAFMKMGGHLVLLSGDRCTHATEDFLKSYGMEIEETPLGAVTPEDNTQQILMYSANPLTVEGLQKEEVLCTAFEQEYLVAVRRKIGKGKLTAISDYGLFLNARLEKLNWASPSNIYFLRELLGTSDASQ